MTSLAEDEETTKELMKYGSQPAAAPQRATTPTTGPYIYKVPLATLPQSKMVFRRTVLTYEQTAALVYNEGASFTTDWQRLRNPPPVNFKPVIRLRTGHIGPLISSGQLGTVNLGDMLVRGAATKEIVAQDEYGQVVEKDSRTCKTWTERFSTKIYCLDQQRQVQHHQQARRAARCCWSSTARCCMKSSRTATRRSTPAPRPRSGRYSAGSCRARNLPGRQEAGLLTAQKHVVAAICRVLKETATPASSSARWAPAKAPCSWPRLN